MSSAARWAKTNFKIVKNDNIHKSQQIVFEVKHSFEKQTLITFYWCMIINTNSWFIFLFTFEFQK